MVEAVPVILESSKVGRKLNLAFDVSFLVLQSVKDESLLNLRLHYVVCLLLIEVDVRVNKEQADSYVAEVCFKL